jgi:sugar transferase (PEP-CTERM/EpsH1 system associated)
MVDVDSMKWEELAPAERFPRSWILRREARALRAFEADVAARAAACLTVNEREREVLQRLAPGARIVVVPNGIDYAHFAPPAPPAATVDVVFCGVMSYAPNERAALWMAEEVWPRVRAARPDARFIVVGADPTPAVRALEQKHAGIAITGGVADVRPFLWKAAVAVAPIGIARGLQNKVLEAVAAGLPCVVTPAVAEGLPREIRNACPVAADPQPFAERVLAILDMEAQARRSLAARADLTALAWGMRLAPVRALIEAAALRLPVGGGADPD